MNADNLGPDSAAAKPTPQDSTLGRDWPDRRKAVAEELLDLNLSHPLRRKTDSEAMTDRLAKQDKKRDAAKFAETPVGLTGFGDLA